MGTFVELITYYLLISWNLRDSLSIEIALPEYGKPIITHNIEYSLHPIKSLYKLDVKIPSSINSNMVNQLLQKQHNTSIQQCDISTNILFKNRFLRNSCMINKNKKDYRFIANLHDDNTIIISKQVETPYMIFECKRVGRDAKQNKGPQAIEKAKQGSYVAKSVSSLQKIWDSNGNIATRISS